MPSKVLVTGASGFIGAHVSARLRDDGYEVVGFDSSASRREESIVHGDVRDDEALRRLPDDIDGVVHLAARVGVRESVLHPAEYLSVNVDGTAALLRWADERDIRARVFASSSSVYGRRSEVPFRESDPLGSPLSPYAATKQAGEWMFMQRGESSRDRVVCLRLFSVYGPGQRPDLVIRRFAESMIVGRPIEIFGDGTSTRDYTHVSDVSRAFSSAVSWTEDGPPRTIAVNVGAGRGIPLVSLVESMATHLGVQPEVVHQPERSADARHTRADLSAAMSLLGYAPSIRFEDGLKEFVDSHARANAAHA